MNLESESHAGIFYHARGLHRALQIGFWAGCAGPEADLQSTMHATGMVKDAGVRFRLWVHVCQRILGFCTR